MQLLLQKCPIHLKRHCLLVMIVLGWYCAKSLEPISTLLILPLFMSYLLSSLLLSITQYFHNWSRKNIPRGHNQFYVATGGPKGKIQPQLQKCHLKGHLFHDDSVMIVLGWCYARCLEPYFNSNYSDGCALFMSYSSSSLLL